MTNQSQSSYPSDQVPSHYGHSGSPLTTQLDESHSGKTNDLKRPLIPHDDATIRWLLICWIVGLSFAFLLLFFLTRDPGALAALTILGGAITIVFAYYFTHKP